MCAVAQGQTDSASRRVKAESRQERSSTQVFPVQLRATFVRRFRGLTWGAVPEPVDRTESLRAVLTQVTNAWRTPGTRLGFWVHFSTMFAPAMLVPAGQTH